MSLTHLRTHAHALSHTFSHTLSHTLVRSRRSDLPAVAYGDFTVRRVHIDGLPEGIRVGARSSYGATYAIIENTYARISSPQVCPDW